MLSGRFLSAVFLWLASTISPLLGQETIGSILANRDPLSCFIVGSSEDICNGRAGAWQLARLSFSVASTAKALELAGIGIDNETLQAKIFSDAATFGFDAALVTPTLALLDLASIEDRSLFGPSTSSVKSLAALSIESLYPGMLAALKIPPEGLPDVSRTTGFDGFGEFAVARPQDLPSNASIASYVPFTHPELGAVKPFLGLTQPAVFGERPSDFAFGGARAELPNLQTGELAGFPLALGFTEHVGSQVVGEAPSSPLQGLACVYCTNFPPSASNFSPDMIGASFDGGTGAEYMDSFAANTQDGAKKEGTPVGSCFETCVENSADIKRADDKWDNAQKKAGVGMLSLAAGAVDPEPVSKTAFILGGLGLLVESKEEKAQANYERNKGVDACSQQCKPVPEKPASGSCSGGTGGSTDSGDAGNGGNTGSNSAQSGDEPDSGGECGTPATMSEGVAGMGVEGGPDEPTPALPEPKAQPGGTREISGGAECEVMIFARVSYCNNNSYEAGGPSCLADSLGEVACLGPNVLRDTTAPSYASLPGVPQLVGLPSAEKLMLFGDMRQLQIVAQSGAFDLREFTAVRGGSVELSAEALLSAQSKAFLGVGSANDQLAGQQPGLTDDALVGITSGEQPEGVQQPGWSFEPPPSDRYDLFPMKPQVPPLGGCIGDPTASCLPGLPPGDSGFGGLVVPQS